MANSNDKITVDDIIKIMDDQRIEAWDNSFENPDNYNKVRAILTELGM